jgi:DNA primase
MARWQKETCPVCGSEHFGVTPDNGVGFCFVCGHWTREGNATYKPRVRSEHIPEIRNMYAQAASYYHSALDGEARRYLLGRGFTDETIQRQQIGYCPLGKNPMYKDPIAQEAGLATSTHTGFLAGRITFPYFMDDHTITDIRGRSLNANEELRYKSPYNDAFFRGADYPYNYHLRTRSKHIILTEGEIAADIATQIQHPTMALPGILAWREGLVADNDTQYTIIFDSQRRNMQIIRRAIMRVADKLHNPLVGTLPLMGKDKMDIDALILDYGASLFADIVNTALPYEEWKTLQRF